VRGLPRFDGRSAFSTWAYRVATNACLDELRRRSRRPDPGLPELEEAPVNGPPDVADLVAGDLALDEALRSLPEEFRAPVVLRDVLGFDYADIAATLAIPPGTVRSRIARGRAALAGHLGGNQAPPDERPTAAP
jgi:RNA polymerase sigma-70 factor (ECF subfamily)